MTVVKCRRVWKSFRDNRERELPVLRGVSFALSRGDVLGVLGNRSAGKTTLLNLLAQKQQPDRGLISLKGTVSIPVGFPGWIARNLSPDENVRFLASLYGSEPDAAVDYVRAFADVKARDWRKPWNSFEGPRKRLVAFAASLSVPCSLYVMEGNPLVGDPGLQERCLAALHQRAEEAAIIWFARRPMHLQRVANRYAVLAQGKLSEVADRERALEQLGTEAA